MYTQQNSEGTLTQLAPSSSVGFIIMKVFLIRGKVESSLTKELKE